MLTDRSAQIWADAVCINQNDLNERSSQVTFMGDIYKSAKGCQIWLGTVEEIKNLPDESIVSTTLRSHPCFPNGEECLRYIIQPVSH